jgi:hypothetical protein
MTDTSEIIKLATIMFQMWGMEAGPELDALGAACDAQVQAVGSSGAAQAMMVMKLMQGTPYAVVTDNPDTIRKAIEIANEIGATFEQSGVSWPKEGLTRLVIAPPTRRLQ